MNKMLIIYHSHHHLNTKKLVENAISDIPVDCIDITKLKIEDLQNYEIIGLAAGIYYGKHHKVIMEFVDHHKDALLNKKVFVIYTAGANNSNLGSALINKLNHYNIQTIGTFNCLGWDSFGPYKIIGGIHKDHPTTEDIQNLKDVLLTLI